MLLFTFVGIMAGVMVMAGIIFFMMKRGGGPEKNGTREKQKNSEEEKAHGDLERKLKMKKEVKE